MEGVLVGRSSLLQSCRVAGLALALIACVPALALGQSVNLNLAWNQSSESNIAGYRVYSGTAPGVYTNNAWVPFPQNTFAFPAAPGVRYYFATTAVDTRGRESPYSAWVSGAVPTFAQPASQSGAAGVAITPLTMSVSDPDAGALQFSATGLPAGLTIDPQTGRITGTPTTAASSTVTVTVFDGHVRVSRSFTWLVTGTLSTVSVTPSSGTGTSATFVAQVADTLGVADIAVVHLRVADAANGSAVGVCQVRYERATGLIALRDDAGNWMAGAVPGSAGTPQNSQCALSLAGSRIAVSGQSLTVTVPLSFTAAYGGVKQVNLYATTVGGGVAGWTTHGTWTVPSSGSGATAGAVTPSSGSGAAATFAAQFTDPLGIADLAVVHMRVADAANGGATNTCQVRYEPATGLISLRDDAGNWMSGAVPGTLGAQQNSQCALSVAGSSVAAVGQTLTVSAALSFTAAYAGPRIINLYAATVGGANTGWQQRGTWTVVSAPLNAVSVTPASGSGSAATFVAQFTDSLGVADISVVHVRVAAAANGGATSTCQVRYDRTTGLLALRDDAGNWMTGSAPGSAGSQSNSQCTLNPVSSSVTASGQSLTVRAAVSFRPAYAGAKSVSLYAASVGGTNTGWQPLGTWIVP